MPARGRAEPEDFHDGIITGLVVRRGHGDRVRVHLDGRIAFDLSAEVADRAGLRVGDLLSAQDQQELRLLDTPYRAHERALRLLAVRDRSERELSSRLKQAGFEPAVAEETVGWLRGLGHLDDRRFAADYAAEKRRSGWGSRRVRSELAGRGIERSVIDEVLRDLEGEAAGADEGANALMQTVRRRFSPQFLADPDAAERRLAGFLGRRGYDWDTIHRMAETMRAEALAERSPSSLP
jgi:regulatory protein